MTSDKGVIRAAVCPAYGDPSLIEIRELPAPEVGPGMVGVRVEAAAVNFPDVLLIANRYQIPIPVPFVPGSEFAGTVSELGPGVDSLALGDRVFGTVMAGAFAEKVAVRPASLTALPSGVDARHAAAFGVAHRTAFHTLRSVAALAEGENLVVLGAGGGVGLAAVQLGASMGARVTAVASNAEKLEVAQRNGAIAGINWHDVDLRAALRVVVPDGSDVVLDPVGGDLSEPALRSLRYGGRFVTVGYAAGAVPRIPLNLVLLKGIAILGFEFRSFVANRPGDTARNESELMAMLASGRATPHIGASHPLDETAAALALVASGDAIGKVVIDVTPG